MAQNEIITIEVQGLEYVCPPTPKLSTIRRYSKNTEDQIYFRDTTYEQWDWELPQTEWEPEQLTWYEEEIERLHVGTWIMINGVPTYLNKYAHFFHQWWVLLSGLRPDFKETSLEYFRFFELCEKDRFCFGDLGIKGRRVGLSSMSASIKVLIGLLENNTLSGIVSKTGTDAYEMYLMSKNGIEKLPRFITPEIASVTESEVHIAKQTPRISKNNKYLSADKGKNNRINWLDTSETAYDGRAMRHVTIDEAGKWKKYNVKTCLGKISDTLITGATMVGKVSVFSTVDKGDAGGDNFREIWDGSDHISGKKDVYGRTKTKLKRFFIPAYRGYLGYVGKHGESIIENPTPQQVEFLKTHKYYNYVSNQWETCPDPAIGAKQWLQVTRDMLAGDSEALSEEMRKNPFEWKEVFKGANNKCKFKLEDVNAQIEKVEAILLETHSSEMGRRMTFRRNLEGKAVPEDDQAGMWYIHELIENNNRCVYKSNIKCPDNVIYGAAGLDTYMHSRSAVEDGSDACLMVVSREKTLDPYNINSYSPTAMFLGHPDSKDDFHKQISLGLEYYGIKMLAERAETSWEDYFTSPTRRLASPKESEVKHGYLVTTKRWDGTEVYGKPSQQSKDTIEQHLSFMVEYALNNIHKIRFLRLLKDMRDFDPDERTKYDACMAFGYALMALTESVKQSNIPKANPLSIIPIHTKKVNIRNSA